MWDERIKLLISPVTYSLIIKDMKKNNKFKRWSAKRRKMFPKDTCIFCEIITVTQTQHMHQISYDLNKIPELYEKGFSIQEWIF